jgi:hypothetical protein
MSEQSSLGPQPENIKPVSYQMNRLGSGLGVTLNTSQGLPPPSQELRAGELGLAV